jgi:hypothetical protein
VTRGREPGCLGIPGQELGASSESEGIDGSKAVSDFFSRLPLRRTVGLERVWSSAAVAERCSQRRRNQMAGVGAKLGRDRQGETVGKEKGRK